MLTDAEWHYVKGRCRYIVYRYQMQLEVDKKILNERDDSDPTPEECHDLLLKAVSLRITVVEMLNEMVSSNRFSTPKTVIDVSQVFHDLDERISDHYQTYVNCRQ